MRFARHHLTDELTARFVGIRTDLGIVEEFGEDTLALARQRAALASVTPSADRVDRRDLDFVAIDPAGSRDLDQALHLQRRGSGFRFHYAIADVGHWVNPGDALDRDARQRGTTIYSPDRRIPLHPTELSEGAASLFADVDRPVVLWTIDVDQRGLVADVGVERAVVRNRRTLTYHDAQRSLDDGTADDVLQLVRELGELRLEVEVARGGISLDLPEQSVDRVDGHYQLRYDAPLPVERWNAQLSLCCGMAAAQLMIDAGFGILRTLPPADTTTMDRLRQHSAALGVPWPPAMTYAQWIRSLDATTAVGAALMNQAARTLRGSGYLAFDGDLPAAHRHEALATEYAHVTAPLRRLVDRFGAECALAAAAGRRPESWVTESIGEIGGLMESASRRASQVDRAAVDLMEAAVLAHRVGDEFEVAVTANTRGFSTIQLRDPAVIATIDTVLDIGSTHRVRLEAAEIEGPVQRFSLTSGSA